MRALVRWLLARRVGKEEADRFVEELGELHQLKVAAEGEAAGDRWLRRELGRALLDGLVGLARRRRRQDSDQGQASGSFGSSPRLRRRGGHVMESLFQDVRFALRTLARRPVFAVVATTTLSLGIGASTSMFSVVDGVLLRPPSYRDRDRLVKVWEVFPGWEGREGLGEFWDRMGISYGQYQAWREHATLFEEVAIFHESRVSEMTLSGRGDPERVSVGVASASLLPALGVSPALGRGFLAQEDASVSGHAGQVALLSFDCWRSRFGADRDILGSAITLDGRTFEVVGVLPRGFRFPSLLATEKTDIEGHQDFWIPLGNEPLGTSPDDPVWDAVGRLLPGVSLESAKGEAQQIMEAQLRLVPRRQEELAGMNTPLTLLLCCSGLLLLVGCSNVVILFVAESTGRLRELAIRSSLGASRWRIVRQLLTESVVIGLAGSLVGVGAAFWGTRILLAMAPPIPHLDRVGLSPWVLSFAVGLGLCSGIVSGTLPALLASRPSRNQARAGALRGPDVLTSGLQQGLVGLQIALTVVLLVGGGLLGRSLGKLAAVDPGFDPKGLTTLMVPLPADRYHSPGEKTEAMRRVLREVKAIPGVQSATLAADLPFPGDRVNPVTVRMRDEGGNAVIRNPDVFRVWSGYFQTLRIPPRAGQVFPESRGPDAPGVIVVGESAAREYWPGRSPIGSSVHLFGADWTVIGVVGDVLRGSLDSAAKPVFYVPLLRLQGDRFRVVARTEGDAAGLVEPMRRAVRAVDPSLPVTEESTMHAWVSQSTREARYRTTLVAVFAVLAIVTAMVGIFGVTARRVHQRARELGVRMALGARVGQLLLSTLKASMATGIAGVLVGLLVASFASRLVARFLFGIRAHDPLTFGVVAFGVLAASAAAALPPARRVSAVDPAKVLREE